MNAQIQTLFSVTHAALSLVIFVMMEGLKALSPWFETPRGKRVLPILPILFGVAAAVGGFVDPAYTRLQDRLIVGVLCGAFSAQVFTVVKKSLLAKGLPVEEIQAPAGPTTPTPGATTPKSEG